MQILGKETLPSLSDVLSIVKADASGRIVKLGTSLSEGSILAVVKPNINQHNNGVAT